jgi:IPT/TIG domain-containing protein
VASPWRRALSPASAPAGSGGFTLTVNGSGFVSTSVVRWNGIARTTTLVSPSQLQAVIGSADLAVAGSVPVSVVTPAPGGGTSGDLTFTITSSAPAPPPPAPGNPAVTQVAADASGVTLTIAWSPASGATSYRWTAAFNDGSAAQQGTVAVPSLQLRMPYHASGAAFGGFICVAAAGPSGVSSVDQSCAALQVPAPP